ncbi:MAG: hypothetical protein ACUVSD_08490 [Thiobacillaceae bacterium]
MSNDRETLMQALEFHGHRCWASVAGVRAGLGDKHVYIPCSGYGR